MEGGGKVREQAGVTVDKMGLSASASAVPCDRPCPLRGRRGLHRLPELDWWLGPNYSGFQGHVLSFRSTFDF